ncbi:MAG: class I SAM-dependent methyltransferase [Marmoricola sp.]
MTSLRGAVSLLAALVGGGERREAAVARLVRPDNLFQPFTTTGPDRYPEEFGWLRDHLDVADPSVLSFGCSTGYELLTLRSYFPTATIRGIDANPLAVRTARKRIREVDAHGTISVVRAGDADGEPDGAHDLVLALAVFRHGELNEAPPRCDPVLRFADFEKTVTGLARTVRPGGLLMIRHANFRFSDCAVADGFEQVLSSVGSVGFQGLPTPVYGRDDTLLPDDQRDDGVYRRF